MSGAAICKTCGQGVDLAGVHDCPGLGAEKAFKWRLVILESPYAGDIDKNVAYARAAMRDCLARGDAPVASHLLYTQPGVLNDSLPWERKRGIDAGLAWGKVAEASVVYTDIGISKGVALGIERAFAEGRPVEWRTIEGWQS
ncbi:hypothetical protein NKI15_06785 [Mesorhizobium sp. M0862]|uniref:DUF7768 domain-containing protein n=1 Tax=Mesorhizobium sp. M0862 TaxID=2957015 RepID=UPI00333665FB